MTKVLEVASIKNLGKTYSGRVIFHKVNITVKKHEPVVIMGENGCGKSTLLKIIAGVLDYSEGEIKYHNKAKISFIPDRFPKLPFSVESYLMHMGKIQGLSTSCINEYINEYFAYLNMPKDFRKTKINKCSKGTIQKVNILQALITKPDLLIMDEPFAGLDEDSEDNFIELIHKVISDGVAIIMACHEKKIAQKITDNIYIFKEKQCHIINGFIEQYYVKFLDIGQVFKHSNLFAYCEAKADGFYEALVTKDNLKEALELLLSQNYELHSINPKYAIVNEFTMP